MLWFYSTRKIIIIGGIQDRPPYNTAKRHHDTLILSMNNQYVLHDPVG